MLEKFCCKFPKTALSVSFTWVCVILHFHHKPYFIEYEEEKEHQIRDKEDEIKKKEEAQKERIRRKQIGKEWEETLKFNEWMIESSKIKVKSEN